MLALASGIPFNGMFLYVLSAPVFLGEHLGLGAGRVLLVLRPDHRRHHGRRVPVRADGRAGQADAPDPLRLRHHGRSSARSTWCSTCCSRRTPGGRCVPIALYAFGWAMMVPVVTLMVLDLVPERRGMASSLQAFVGSAANGMVAGVVAPLVMHSTLGAGGDVARR